MKDYNSLEFFTLCNRQPETALASDGIWYLLRLLSMAGLLTTPRNSQAVNQCVNDTWLFLAGNDAMPESVKNWQAGNDN